MAVNAKEKAMLQKMWEDADSAGGGELPDGTYQFKVLKKGKDGRVTGFKMSDKGKPTFKTQLKCVGGAEEFIGTEIEINDNLETSENMGWFKKKLSRMNISLPEDISDITDGEVADQMIGKTFEGQVKTKNDFLNVYVNRLIGESEEGEESDDEKDDKEEKEDKESDSEIEEGSQVKWGDKTGEVIELMDDGKARVKTEEGDKYRVDISKLELVKEEDEEEDDEEEDEEEAEEKDEKEDKEDDEDEEEDDDDTEFVVPEPDDVADLPASKVKAALKELGFDATKLKNPRAVLRSFCALAHDAKAKLEMSEISPLAEALKVEMKKGDGIKDVLKLLAKAVQKRLG